MQQLKLIGYYMSRNQFMYTEVEFPNKAQELSILLKETFDSTLSYLSYLNDKIKKVFEGNTVFILKDREGRLYAYYYRYNIVRLTNVEYNPNHIGKFKYGYRTWFIPGKSIFIKKEFI